MPRVITAAIAALMLGLCAANIAKAATLNVSSGILHGAFGVDVNGTLYDVQFLDGSCVSLFDGCNQASDFPFQSNSVAFAAAQALLDQVFIDGPAGLFDSHPEYTYGCTDLALCVSRIPVGGSVGPVAINSSPSGSDGLGSYSGSSTFDTTTDTAVNFAVFAPSPVSATPLPATLPLFLTMLGGMGFLKWRRGRRQAA